MRLAELTTALYGRTSLQQEQFVASIAGRNIEIRSMICDVESDTINLDFVVGNRAEDKRDWEIVVRFDPAIFRKELLSYSYGDDVVIIGRVRSAEVGLLPTLTFDLQSIRKSGTTLASRDEAQRAAEASKCFIATACFGDPEATEVITLRCFRDAVLMRSFIGRAFVHGYNRCSPGIAVRIERHAALRFVVRSFLIAPLARMLRWIRSSP